MANIARLGQSRGVDREAANAARFRPGMRGGHYESWFQRANHPERREAFWIRYTIFVPKGRPEDAVGELWGVYFAPGRVTAVKEVHPLAACHFGDAGLDVRVAEATLSEGELRGSAALGGHRLGWDLRWSGAGEPLLLLPERLYEGSFPKAKALVGAPLARFDGRLEVDGAAVEVDGWVGSQNHNWGVKHTDEYAWGQVAGFDEAPDAFLEVSTARLHLGPVRTPWLTPLVLRLDGREHRLSGILRAATRNRGRYDVGELRWSFAAGDGDVRIEGTIDAGVEDFVALPYDNPPGGTKICLNTKVARCVLDVQVGGRTVRLQSHRAAFEILGDEPHPRIPVIDAPSWDRLGPS